MTEAALLRALRRLDPVARQRVHREVCRLVEPIYRDLYLDRWRAGVSASTPRR